MRVQELIKGRPASLAVLDYGLFQVHDNGRIIGIVGFLIRTDRDETILVDTGFPEASARDAAKASAAHTGAARQWWPASTPCAATESPSH